MKNVLAKIIVVLIIVAQLGITSPTPARAIFGLGDITFDPANLAQMIFEWAKSFVATTVRKRLLDQIVDQTVQYVQGGGDPKFVTDWQGFFAEAGQAAAGDFVQSVGAGFLCSPFNFQIQLLLGTPPKFSESVTCTLDKIVGNIEDFYDDFRNGGWLAYREILTPQNNFYTAYMMAESAKQHAAADAAFAAYAEVDAGGGYLGIKQCDANGKNCSVTTPGGAIGSTITKAIGADFDFILNAEQIGDYVGAIANALVNRLFKEAQGGLAGVTKAPPRKIAATPQQACSNFSGQAFQDCIDERETSNASFNLQRSKLIKQIRNGLEIREQSTALLSNSFLSINSFIDKLGKLDSCRTSKGFASTTPIVVAGTIQNLHFNISNSLPKAKTLLDIVISQTALNGQAVKDGKVMLERLDKVTQNDWAALALATAAAADQLGQVESESFLQEAQKTNQEIGALASPWTRQYDFNSLAGKVVESAAAFEKLTTQEISNLTKVVPIDQMLKACNG